MPFVHTKSNVTITPAKEEILKAKLGKAIENLPGKTEEWLMLQFTGDCNLWFRGDKSEPIAFVEIMIHGRSNDEGYEAMTAAATDIIAEELGIAPKNIYVEYQVAEKWGWSGYNV